MLGHDGTAGRGLPAGPIYAMPPGVAFVDALAGQLLAETESDPRSLASMLVLLPTRRAVRSLSEAFLRAAEGRPLLLPRMVPLGDIDPEELLLTADETSEPFAADLPPAITPPRRQMLLAAAIAKGPHRGARLDQALRLAEALGRFLDQVQMERLNLADLARLVPEDHALHWRQTLDFLTILSEVWPEIRAAEGGIDPVERRLRLIAGQAERWRRTPPGHPVIVAGSTGSLTATAELIEVIATLPQGRVVLPGLDRTAGPALLAAIRDDPTHPQAALLRLLDRLGRSPADIPEWPQRRLARPPEDRHRLLMAALRPAAVADMTDLKKDPAVIAAALSGLSRIDCEGPEAEAQTVALLMRRALETPGKTAALVTPDRGLARRVAAELRRWAVEVDDSAGVPLLQTPAGLFFRLAAAAVVQGLAPVPLLALLKHPLCALGLRPGETRFKVRVLERRALRGARPAPGIAGLAAALGGEPPPAVGDLLDRLERRLAPLLRLFAAETAEFVDLVQAHIAVLESLAATDVEGGAERLWAGEAGEALSTALADLAAAGQNLPPVAPAEYPAAIEALLSRAAVRPRFGLHPRLAIWGPLEARLQHADLVILGGLNEGTWPAEPEPDPWLSRPMRAAFGLPPAERRIGLSAHDFVQSAMAPEVVLTRSLRVEGTPTVAARWLLRLDALIMAVGGGPEIIHDRTLPAWAGLLDRPERVEPAGPPAPKPPLELRPRRLGLTEIATWMADPYAIYAKHVLKLKPLDPVDAEIGAAARGSLVHELLDRFTATYPDTLPQDALDRLLQMIEERLGPELSARPAVWAFWRPRLDRIARWFIDTEREYRQRASLVATEVKGTLTLDLSAGPFVVAAKADRIDRLERGGLAIIDYKTGVVPKLPAVLAGTQPQLPLEAAIAVQGGFAGLAPETVDELAYWRITGGREPGEILPVVNGGAAALAKTALDGLMRLVQLFDDPVTPYESVPWPERAPRFSDYAHLARIAEWGGEAGE